MDELTGLRADGAGDDAALRQPVDGGAGMTQKNSPSAS
jgi:hypothetical protein